MAAGWAVRDADKVNLAAARGVAAREFVLKPPHGRVDYLYAQWLAPEIARGEALMTLEGDGINATAARWPLTVRVSVQLEANGEKRIEVEYVGRSENP